MFPGKTIFNLTASRAAFELSGSWLQYRVPVELIDNGIDTVSPYLPQGTWQEGDMLLKYVSETLTFQSDLIQCLNTRMRHYAPSRNTHSRYKDSKCALNKHRK